MSPRQEVYIPMVNCLGFTQRMDGGMKIGTAQPIEVVSPMESSMLTTPEKSENHLGVQSVNVMDVTVTEPVSARRKKQLWTSWSYQL